MLKRYALILWLILVSCFHCYAIAEHDKKSKDNKKSNTVVIGTRFSISDITFTITSDSTCELTKCRMSGVINIPDSIQHEDKLYALTAVGPMAFSDYEKVSDNDLETPKSITNTFSVQHVLLPETVTKIGYGAFFRCYTIETLSFRGNIEEVEYAAFFECKNLKMIAFTKDENYKEITGKKSIAPKKIHGHAFEKCENLTQIDLSSVEYIGENAFSDCKSINGSIKINSSVKHIGENAFSGCNSISEASIMADISKMPNGIFCGCTKLIKVQMSDNISEIGNSSFSGCIQLNNISLPSSIKSIGNYAFENCKQMESINIPTSTRTIGDGAFFDCSNLTVKLHRKIKTIGSGAFFNCKGKQIF